MHSIVNKRFPVWVDPVYRENSQNSQLYVHVYTQRRLGSKRSISIAPPRYGTVLAPLVRRYVVHSIVNKRFPVWVDPVYRENSQNSQLYNIYRP